MSIFKRSLEKIVFVFLIVIFQIELLGGANKAWGGDFQFDLGGQIENFNYAETLTAPAKSTESAVVVNALVGFRYLFTPNAWLQVRAAGSRGIKSLYDGSELHTNEPVQALNFLGFETEEALMFIPLFGSFAFHFGYGTRIWNRFLAGNPGYLEIYKWNYSPIGIDYYFYRAPNIRFWLDLSYRPTSHGKIQVITSRTTEGGVDSEMDLGAKPGYRISLPLQAKINSFWGLELIPYFEFSEIDQSNVVKNITLTKSANAGIYEPPSKTNRSGVEVILNLNF